MDFGDIFEMGAGLIKSNSDKATDRIDSSVIMNAFMHLFGSSGRKTSAAEVIMESIMGNLTSGGKMMEIVSSWIGSGENRKIEPDEVEELLGSEKIGIFAEKLGIDTDSAKRALADSLPQMIDHATPDGETDSIRQMLSKSGAMEMLGKFFS